MCTCIRMTELLGLSQPKQTPLLRCVEPFFFTYLSNQTFGAQEVQQNYYGYGAHFPAADPPEALPDVRPYPAPPVDMPPAANDLRNLLGRFLNNPGTDLNMFQIVPGRNGRFEVWIVLELADIF